jgi:molybdopterin-guanine dinucleotide biosynthesis protein A
MQKFQKIHASAAILIGGRSTRFGSDKALLTLNGKNLALTIYQRLYKLFKEVYFVSNKPNKYNQFGDRVFEDIIPGKGTLGGIYSALHYATDEYCFITACDLPFLDKGLIQTLWARASKTDIIAPVWKSNIEPLVAFYHRRCLSEIEKAIKQNERMVKGFWKSATVAMIDVTKFYSLAQLEKIFFNINTPDDYRRAQEF